MLASKIIKRYITFFEKKDHKRIANAPLIPQNDPTTLFTSSGMQPLVPYLLGEIHPEGKRLVNVQNSFRAQDIDEIGDNRHTTFFRMIGNWSLGDYFKNEQLSWIFTFLTHTTEGLGLDPNKLYVSVFSGNSKFEKDIECVLLWKELFQTVGIEAKEGKKIFLYDVEKNWWSRSGIPEKMPIGEPGGPSSEIFYDFGEELNIHTNSPFKNQKCHPNCDCGRYLEIGNNVFMQYKKFDEMTFEELPNKNVDFGGGLERLVAATENQPDVFQTSLFTPIIQAIEKETKKSYEKHQRPMRIIADHFISAVFITANGVYPSNKEQGYISRRLIRRGLDNLYSVTTTNITPIIEAIVEQYQETDPYLVKQFESIKGMMIEEEQKYTRSRNEAQKFIQKRYKKQGDELIGTMEISADDAFILYTTHGLSPTQIKSLGYTFDDQIFADKMGQHQNLSRKGAEQKFAGGLADHQEQTIKGHTATHLLHQALRDILGSTVHQTGSNITTQRLRFDFNYDKKLTPEELREVENIVNEKIHENLPVSYELLSLDEAKKRGAIGLFDAKYQEKVKVYFIGEKEKAYSKEFCGGPHVNFTGRLKSFKIIKQESLGKNQQRVYALTG